MTVTAIDQARSIESLFTQKTRNPGKQYLHSPGSADRITISNEAMEKYLAMKNANATGKTASDFGDVAAKVSDWYDNFRENGGMVPDPDYSKWPPENLARRQKLIEERDALIPSTSVTSSFTENRKLFEVLDTLMALDAVGGEQVLSDSDMATAVKSLHDAMDRWEGTPGMAAWKAGEGPINAPPVSPASLAKADSSDSEEEARLKRERLKQELLQGLPV